MIHSFRRCGTRRRGVVIVFVSVSLVTLLFFAALAVDVGYICALTAEQQNNADAGSLAGASGLQDEDWVEANRRTLSVLALNQKPQGYLSLEDQIIEYGWFDSVNLAFHVVDDPRDAFAVRVRAARNNTPLFFAALMGFNSTDVWREAVAIGTKPCGGIWGLEGVRIPGSVVVNSYDSTAGPYDPFDFNADGDVCSGREIRISGSIELHGDAMAGLGYGVEVNGQPLQTGVTTATLDGVVAPPMDFTDAETTNDNGTIGLTDDGEDPFSSGLNMDIKSHDNLTLAPGTYLFDSLTFRSFGSLTVTGPTTIYVRGDIDVGGSGTINTTTDPADLMIYSTGSTVKMTGEVEFYGSILAPYAEITLGGTSSYYGAVVGLTVKIFGDFEFHVDESLPLSQPWFDPPKPFLVQ